MPVYEITAPDGKIYEVSGNGTQEEALASFKAQWKPQDSGLKDFAQGAKASFDKAALGIKDLLDRKSVV